MLGDALSKMVVTYSASNIHLIGHSLGAHIVGFAGQKFFKEKRVLLPWITGLDPANPCWCTGHQKWDWGCRFLFQWVSALARNDSFLIPATCTYSTSHKNLTFFVFFVFFQNEHAAPRLQGHHMRSFVRLGDV